MKHLSKQEAIGRMMLAQAILIDEKIHCQLEWHPTLKECYLSIYLKKGEKHCQLPILMHPDYRSIEMDLNETVDCISYTWNSKTAAQ